MYGGTGATTFGQGWLYSSGGTSALQSSTSPTVAYITATSTTATSTFAGPTYGLRETDFLSSTTERDGYGAYNLTNFNGAINQIKNGVLSNAKIAYIGDSWVAGGHVMPYFYNYINSNYSFAGVGWVPVDSYAFNVPLTGATKGTAGTWTDTTSTGLGPNMTHTNSTDIATPAYKTVTCVGTDFTIMYLKQPGGGSFDYSVDYTSGTTTVDTSNATYNVGTINITGQTLASHVIPMTINTAGTSGVTLFGVDCTIANAYGIKIYKLGMSGARASTFALASTTLWQSEIAAFNPNLVIITLGTNDIGSVSVATYIANIQTIIANIKAASSTIDILLAPPAISSLTGPAGNVSAYYGPLQDLARQNGYGYVEAGKSIGSYATASQNGLWADTAHLSASGDSAFANGILRYLGFSDTREKYTGDVLNDLTTSYYGKGSNALTYAYNVSGSLNTIMGFGSGVSTMTTAKENTIYGSYAGRVSTGIANSFFGAYSGQGLVSGNYNTGVGRSALNSVTSSSYNTAIGYAAMYTNTTGGSNTVIGGGVLYKNTTGSNNVAAGYYALDENITGSNNVALGYMSLYNNSSATSTVAVGYMAGRGASTVHNNQGGTYLGHQSGYSVGTGGNYNTLLGHQSGYSLTTGAYNIALGQNVNLPSVTDNQQLNIGNVLYGTGMYNGSTVSSVPVLGNIGIGTTTPLGRLSIGGSAGGTTPLFVVASTTSGNATSAVFIIDSNGKVGIGTSSPSGTNSLAVQGQSYFSGSLGIGTTTPSSQLSVQGGGYFTDNIYTDKYFNTSGTTGGYKIDSTLILQASSTNFSTLLGQTAGAAVRSDGINNTAIGYEALRVATSSDYLTAVGYRALYSNTVGGSNTAVGSFALQSNTTAGFNTAVGTYALYNNTTGANNNAFGWGALNANLSGGSNFGMGYASLYSNTTGGNNIGLGYNSLRSNTTGNGNIGIGSAVGYATDDRASVGDNYMTFIGTNVTRNPRIASTTVLTGGVAIGYNATVGADYSMALGGEGTYAVKVGVASSTPWGRLSVAGTAAQTTPLFTISSSTASYATSTAFIIDSNGKVGIGTTTPSATLGLAGNMYLSGSATSTIEGNLNVLNTLHALTSYTGDLFFANNFSFTESQPINASTTQGLYLKNQNGNQVLSIDDTGNLSLTGDLCANGKECFGKSITTLSNTLNTLASSTILDSLSIQSTNQSLGDLQLEVLNIKSALTTLNTTLNTLSSSSTLISSIASSTLEYMASSSAFTTLASSTINTITTTPSFIQSIAQSVLNIIQSTSNWVVGQITGTLAKFTRVESDSVSTKSLCVDDICLSKDQLKALLINSGGTSTSSASVQPSNVITPENNREPKVIEQIISTSTPEIISPISTSTTTSNDSNQITPVIESEVSTSSMSTIIEEAFSTESTVNTNTNQSSEQVLIPLPESTEASSLTEQIKTTSKPEGN